MWCGRDAHGGNVQDGCGKRYNSTTATTAVSAACVDCVVCTGVL
jgi:hypothetical protein